MSITNAQLAHQISQLVGHWRTRDLELDAWMNGTATGGPFDDGRYPLTNYLNETIYVRSPAALQALVDGEVGSAQAFRDGAEDARDAAQVAQTAAETARTLALSYRDAAQGHATAAALSASNAANSEANALVHRNYAAASGNAAATAATAAATAADEAEASATSAASSEAAALTYRNEAATSASAASGSATAASSSASAASASATAASTSASAAATSATNAANAETAALGYRNSAETSATTASSAATTATSAANAASTSANAAAASATAAAESAAAAAASAAEAAAFDPDDFYTKTAADARYRQLSVSITNADITSLAWSKLTGVPSTFAPSAHTHGNADITALAWDKLTGVPSTFTPSSHTHDWSQLTNVPSTFTPSAHTHGNADITALAWDKLTGVPSTFAPSAHTHAISDVTSLQTTLDGKAGLAANNTFTGTNTFDAGAHVPLGQSFTVYNSDTGIGTPDSDGFQIFATDGSRIRFGNRSNGVFTDRATIYADGTFDVTWGDGADRSIGSAFSTTYFLGMKLGLSQRLVSLRSMAADGVGGVEINTGPSATRRLFIDASGRAEINPPDSSGQGTLQLLTQSGGITLDLYASTGRNPVLRFFAQGVRDWRIEGTQNDLLQVTAGGVPVASFRGTGEVGIGGAPRSGRSLRIEEQGNADVGLEFVRNGQYVFETHAVNPYASTYEVHRLRQNRLHIWSSGANDDIAFFGEVGAGPREKRLIGTTYSSHIHYAADEDVYLRGGKDSSKIFIGDAGCTDLLLGNGGARCELRGGGSPSFTYGSVHVRGARSNYCGIVLADNSGGATFMGHTSSRTWGLFDHAASSWMWYTEDGANAYSQMNLGVRTGGSFRLFSGDNTLSASLVFSSGQSVRLSNGNGWIELGPQNSTYSHFVTDRSLFYMGSPLEVNGWVRDYNSGTPRNYIRHAAGTGTFPGGNITVSTSSPSGGTDGDIWLQY